MKLQVTRPQGNAVTLLRRAGYVFQRKETDEMSFVRLLSNGPYPRFHAYVKQDGLTLLINLHLDAKKETYGTSTRHHGEYANEGVVAEETKRLMQQLGDSASIIG